MTSLSCLAATSAPAQVVLVVERGASTYQQVAQGFRSGFSGAAGLEQAELDEGGRLSRELFERWRRNRPQLVITIGTRATLAVNERLPGLPMLYCLTLPPSGNQLASKAIGGIVLDAGFSQQFENAHKLLPGLRRIGLVYDELTSGAAVRRAQQYLGPGVPLVTRNARTPPEAERAIRDLFGNVLGPGDVFWLLWDPVIANPATFRTLVELSLRNKIPLIVPARPLVEAGALISVGANYEAAGRQLAHMAQQILERQAQPGDFRAVAPVELTITVNGEVARRLGVPIPRDLRADILVPAAGADAR